MHVQVLAVKIWNSFHSKKKLSKNNCNLFCKDKDGFKYGRFWAATDSWLPKAARISRHMYVWLFCLCSMFPLCCFPFDFSWFSTAFYNLLGYCTWDIYEIDEMFFTLTFLAHDIEGKIFWKMKFLVDILRLWWFWEER